ncbi:MFS general substrate transporter [Aspergillus brunneoviolaceus CBS 621.78]|uniref:MFS general substrate transporter n=1 Tax=Aspergillus brunneoviolaceus CBS 621.78 TaxID=1450534 RepID=A0ACD1FWK8_9EURO|nr:MFS general substrate transporter [Aspergillus brunneoviolaceus CBS 621.78]RAH41328.1 MFS general substrate transporter [Aspergillus brunneoviolaceus CBS 621.78]
MATLRQYISLRDAAREDVTRAHTLPDGGSSSGTSTPDEKERALIPGVELSRPNENDGSVTYVVGWKEGDPLNPQNWTRARKWICTATVCLIALAVSIPGTIDAPISAAFNEKYHVGEIAGTMVTGMYLIGVGVGSLFAGPFSETFGRNAVYFITLIVFMLFILAKALAPNYGAAIVFRFIQGFFGAAPLTVGGGTVGDIWGPLDVTFSLPFVTMASYSGPILGPIIGAYIPADKSNWTDWISLIIAGAVLVFVAMFQPETYGPTLLSWRAKHLRAATGDSRYQVDESASTSSLGSRLLVNVYRPFQMTITEPIVLLFSFYLILLYIVLFTFLNGFPFIFTQTYGISNSLTFIIWVAMLAGDAVAILLIPLIYGWTKKAAVKAATNGTALQAEVSLYWAMVGGSFLMPISLFWMGWTCYSDISIWSPIIATFVFGYSLVTIFTATYLYIVFVYTVYAGSALGFMTFSRYVISGALQPASIPMYQHMTPHWVLTLVGILATIMAPMPFLLYKYGHQIRAMSKNVQNKA